MEIERHWRELYQKNESTSVSWYQGLPTRSLDWIERVCPERDSRIIDVGAGASTLVDNLLSRGYHRITVLDVAAPALDQVRKRVGDRGEAVAWIEADLLSYSPQDQFDLWHDRAVLHFLREPEQQERYAEVLERSVAPNGYAVIATFAVGGPTRCSGLETVQYDGNRIVDLATSFVLLREEPEVHRTPSGSEQLFSYFLLKKRG